MAAMVTHGIQLGVSRLTHAVLTFPSFGEWQAVVGGSAAIGGGMIVAAYFAGTYLWQPMRSSRALGWAAAYMVLRATLEESVFRALMLPHPKEGRAVAGVAELARVAVVPLLLFTLSHLWTTQRAPAKVMRDVKFLATVTVLGCACTLAYHATGGSLWAAVVTHWLVTYPWMVLLGGYRSTHTPTPLKGTSMARKPAPEFAPSAADVADVATGQSMKHE